MITGYTKTDADWNGRLDIWGLGCGSEELTLVNSVRGDSDFRRTWPDCDLSAWMIGGLRK